VLHHEESAENFGKDRNSLSKKHDNIITTGI
jgi:hypothetical protein